MSDNRKEAKEKMTKAIFISADCWLSVFDLLPPSQLGLGIALISPRFDYYVDEHFKTRKWALKVIRIRSKIGKNGTRQLDSANIDEKEAPIPQIQLLRKITGFKCIRINFIDRNVIAFLHRFRSLFASHPINLIFSTTIDRILVFILHKIWPMFGKNIRGICLLNSFRGLRQTAPLLLNDCPPLRFLSLCFDKFFAEFPPDDSAMASDGQTVAKWLFTPLQNNVPKMFICHYNGYNLEGWDWSQKIELFKAAFANASSPVNFIVVVWFRSSYLADFIVPFELINEFTREQLELKTTIYSHCFLLVRCPIARDESKWTKWEEEAFVWNIYDHWNVISIGLYDEDDIGDGLLDAIPGPNDQQK